MVYTSHLQVSILHCAWCVGVSGNRWQQAQAGASAVAALAKAYQPEATGSTDISYGGHMNSAPDKGEGVLMMLTENMTELETSLVMMAGTIANFLGIGLMCSLMS